MSPWSLVLQTARRCFWKPGLHSCLSLSFRMNPFDKYVPSTRLSAQDTEPSKTLSLSLSCLWSMSWMSRQQLREDSHLWRLRGEVQTEGTPATSPGPTPGPAPSLQGLVWLGPLHTALTHMRYPHGTGGEAKRLTLSKAAPVCITVETYTAPLPSVTKRIYAGCRC